MTSVTLEAWIQEQRDDENCPVKVDTVVEQWDVPPEHLRAHINRDHTIDCDELERVARYYGYLNRENDETVDDDDGGSVNPKSVVDKMRGGTHGYDTGTTRSGTRVDTVDSAQIVTEPTPYTDDDE